jgi:hypothetical protein
MRIFIRPAFILFLSVPVVAFAQSGSSVISGTVKDATGAALPGTEIKVVNEDTGVTAAAASNQEGVYRVPSLVPGAYRVEAELPGFERLVRSKLTLQVGQTLEVELTLKVGTQSETLTVTEAAPLTESQSSNIAQTVTQKMLDGLPLPNRAASSLASLAPGVVMIDPGTGTAENYPVFSVAGGRARNQNFILDGGNVSNAVGLTRPQQLTSLPVDAMQEFQVIANNYSAEFGHSTGGVVTMSTRSGTNDLHGTLFESLQNDVLDARNFFAATRPPIRLNQFGGALGGPIVKDKTHFFVTWEQTRQLTSTAVVQTVPTLANRIGDFSDLRSASGQPVLIYDPSTTVGRARQPFPGNVIPASQFDSVGLAALKNYPLPNRPGTISNANNFGGNSAQTLNRNIVVGRLDHQFRPTDSLTARYYINDSGTDTTGSYGNPPADPDGDLTDVRVQSMLVAHTHVFRPTLVNDLRVTYLRRKFIDTRPGNGDNLAASIGLTGVSNAAFPAFTVPGYATLGNPTAVARYQTPITDRQVLDSVSWFHGKHAFKFGGEIRLGANTETRDRGSSGNFTMTPLITSLPGVAGTGNALASLLLGQVNAASILVSDQIPSRAAYWGVYAQDDWRVNGRLTVNLGLRYEVELPREVVGNKMNSFDPLAINPVSGTPGIVTFAGRNGVSQRAFATDYNNLGPRIGFAYRVGTGKHETVIRGGAGIFYGPTVSNTIGDVAATGFSTSASFVVAQADLQSVFRLSDGFPAVTRPALNSAYGAVPLGQKPNTAVGFFNPNQVAPISYQYNLDIQREIARDLLLEVGYIGNVSHHLTANDFSLDQVPPELMGAGDAQSRRPFPQFSNVTWINPSIGNSTYHGGFVRAEKRFSGGFAFLAHYTWSKFIDDVEAANEFNNAAASYGDAYNRRLDKGLSGSDVPNRLIVSVLYEVPAFRTRRIWNVLAAGWKLGILQTIESGPPFTVITASNTTNAFSAGPQRPNVLYDPVLAGGQQTLYRWFDTSAFVAPALYTFGNAPRDGLRAGTINTTDLTLEKSFALSDRFKAQLRGELYNLLNRANFDVPGHTFGAADFGVVSIARPARTAQLALRLSF